MNNYNSLLLAMTTEWERGKNNLVLKVLHARQGRGAAPVFAVGPETLGLHPTQIYESISMGLLLLVLLAYYPLKKCDGSVFILFMAAYAVHRFLNEMLRTDTENGGL